MKKRHILGAVLGVVVLGGATAAFVASPTVYSGNAGEAPELGRTGEFSIGTTIRNYDLAGRTRISGMGALTGNIESSERTLTVRFWYPSDPSTPMAEPASYSHTLRPIDLPEVDIISQGIASPDAQPRPDGKFPLILMSHGFNGWNTQFSNLGEHIASRGYVVASIDHADAPINGMTDFLVSFLNVLTDRTQDQQQVLAQIIKGAKDGSAPAASLIDTETVGLLGYSMGSYGAIATAGASYDFAKDPLSNLPEAAQEQLRDATQEAAPIKALVTFAPWGGQPDNRAWTPQSLAKINVPTLIVAGSEDDVVNYKEGVRWLFESLTGTDRHLLVYREARHNIVGNNFEMPEGSSFTAAEYLNEPVWRSDRLNAINQHFVTAFFDWKLKGDETKSAYLDVPTTDSNASNWEVSFGDQLNGEFAGADEADHWRGFQRRWAVGLEMYSAKAGQSGRAGAATGDAKVRLKDGEPDAGN